MKESSMAGEPAVDVWRGPRIESGHAVAACVCNVDGDIQYQVGTIDVPIFLRSAAKPFIAASAIRAGVDTRFGLEQHEIAIMAASHNGEARHVEAVASILAKIGATESDLRCGIPMAGLTQLHHNCSGKHAGILALAQVLGAPLNSYLDIDHPAQCAIVELCERVFSERFTPDRIGVDGCGVPVIALSLRRSAIGFARFATLCNLDAADQSALAVVRNAMITHPWYVAGSLQFDTDLMRAADGTIVAKGGAEGVHASGLIGAGLGVVVKIIDGSPRARPPAVIAVLDRLNALDSAAREQLERHARPPITNAMGRKVGEIIAR